MCTPGKTEVSKPHESHGDVCNMVIPTDLGIREMGDIGTFILEDFKEESVLIYASLNNDWKTCHNCFTQLQTLMLTLPGARFALELPAKSRMW